MDEQAPRIVIDLSDVGFVDRMLWRVYAGIKKALENCGDIYLCGYNTVRLVR